MVFERDIPSCSLRVVLIQYLRRALIDLLLFTTSPKRNWRRLHFFPLENLIDLLLRSADGGQVLAVLRTAWCSSVGKLLKRRIAWFNSKEAFSCRLAAMLTHGVEFPVGKASSIPMKVVCVMPFSEKSLFLPFSVVPWLFAFPLFVCRLFARCLLPDASFRYAFLRDALLTDAFLCDAFLRYPFPRDAYMMVTFSVFLPFTVAFFTSFKLGTFQIWLHPFHLWVIEFVIDIPS